MFSLAAIVFLIFPLHFEFYCCLYVEFKVQTCVLLPVSKCSLGNCANSLQERELQRLIGRILTSLYALGGTDRMPERSKKVWRATTVFKSIDSVLA